MNLTEKAESKVGRLRPTSYLGLNVLRHHVLLVVMPVFFLSTGLRTNWTLGGAAVFVAAAVLLVASVTGKLLGTHLAGKVLNWAPGESAIIGWLLQTTR
jgi:Kef-type K+ transport system membrane component KefB